jgi:hypothetical protein
MTKRVGAVFAQRAAAGDTAASNAGAGAAGNAGAGAAGNAGAGAGAAGGADAGVGRAGMTAAPPGVDPDEFRLALLEDTYEVVAGLELVAPALILDDGDWPAAEAVTWPGTPVIHAGGLSVALERLAELGAEQAAVVAADAPDLPPLLIGKLFRALGHAQAAVCPAEGGGLVALAMPLPPPPWLFHAVTDAGFGLFDLPDAFVRLRAAAPRPGVVQAGPGWHRLRTTADLDLLDLGLEGWESTRALLSGRPLR